MMKMGAVKSGRLWIKVANVWAKADDVMPDKLIGAQKRGTLTVSRRNIAVSVVLLSWPVVLLVLNFQVFSDGNSLFLKIYF